MNYISKFNPYSMDDETILAVATGRKQLLHQLLDMIKGNINNDSTIQHALIKAPRGMGKSFFLKYLQINFYQDNVFKNSDFLLLPEEQSNVFTPADLLRLIMTKITGIGSSDSLRLWDEVENAWQKQLSELKSFIENKRTKYGKYILVVVIENLNVFFSNILADKKKGKVYESQFRYLLQSMANLTIIGSTPKIESGATDGNYNRRVFHAFKKFSLRQWNEEDYFKYFERRRSVRKSGLIISEEQYELNRLKLKAISQFTGGSPRLAVVMTDLLLEDNVLSTANTILGMIDDLTPYYQGLTSNIPPKSKILFDTLIRKGENLTQRELAEILGTNQSTISQAFNWLNENGYLIGKKMSDSRAFSYQVADRLHVLYYRLREIQHDINITSIWLLSDFLVSFYHNTMTKNNYTHTFKDYETNITIENLLIHEII